MATLVTDIPQLKFNKMSKEKYEELLANGELVENEFYITPENEEDISDKADITYVDEQIALKADKETTYTKEEVDNLLENIDALPEQTDNSGKLLSTDGENALWIDAPSTLPVMDDTVSGKYLTTDGVNASWDVVNVIADQHSGFSPKKIWTGTKAQYNQITTKSGLTLYYVHEDGIYLGDKLISDVSTDITINGWNIFDHKFSDHLLNDPSWVRSDTYSWQDGGIYFTAYEELEKENSGRIDIQEVIYYQYGSTGPGHIIGDIPCFKSNPPAIGDRMYYYNYEGTPMPDGGLQQDTITLSEYTVSAYDETTQIVTVISDDGLTTAEYLATEYTVTMSEPGNLLTDTYGEISINYYKSANGLKICLPDQSDAIEQLYANTGVAWYYIIDTENKRFKLPRKVSETLDLNTVPVVGNGMTLGLTNGSQYSGIKYSTQHGIIDRVSLYGTQVGSTTTDGTESVDDLSLGVTTDPANSGIIADLSSIGYKEVTEQTYLYFFMGDTLRDARIIDVNAVIEDVNTINETLDNKANIDLSNILENIDYVVESYHEGLNWYRIYKSGWVEQGGFYQAQTSGWNDITLLKEMTNSYYSCNATLCGSSSDTESAIKVGGETINTTTVLKINMTERYACHWEVKGQGAQ